ncbi:histidine kinase [Pseudohaliea sp.]|uniref:sensor histidine kinase n=1 Tax=Pseudohaliea sp. TaxID=2740289 RepID=UPI0032EEE868
MSRRRQGIENHLLIASGAAAVALTAIINGIYTDFWPRSLLFAAFLGLFLAAAYDAELELTPRAAALCVYGMAALSAGALLANPDSINLILAVVLIASAPYHLSPRRCWLLLALVNVAYLAIFELSREGDSYRLAWFSFLALEGFAITSSLSRQREVQVQEVLTRQNNELLAARAMLAQQSRAEERLRIAGDLHDSIGHQLTALRLQLEALAHQCPADLHARVESCQQLSRELLDSVRGIVRQLSEERRSDLAAAIDRLAEVTPDVELRVTTPLPDLPAELGQQLVFCFQEAIHNAIRHGRATVIEIACRDRVFSVTDNGIGTRGAVVPGFGLGNIEKRLSPYRGRVKLTPLDGRGCRLTLELPHPEGAAA